MTGPARDREPRVPLVPASYLILTRENDGQREVLLQLRQGTGFMDGWWACGAAGHVEAGESATAAVIGEALEELGIQITADALTPITTLQRHSLTGSPVEQRADIFFACEHWLGEPGIMEPAKSAALQWFPFNQLPERLVPHERQVLEAYTRGKVPAYLQRGFDQSLTLVAALGRNRVIGADGTMPWHLPEDLQHFKQTTLGGTMIMGRSTWDAIGRALPGRSTIVLTRERNWQADGALVAHSLAEALTCAPDTEIFVVGGGQIYREALPLATRLVLTEIDAEPPGDTTFPEVDPANWHEAERIPRDGFAFVTYLQS
ncbi:dihydrofolate reductase [Demetria terragena]|uniref:dihydrofolate reductase n=1 Tax=Demetria terragena TaxID=63959 RepID=UPI00036CF1C9|nr:dihydrofolate reductase [Demetria terragena]